MTACGRARRVRAHASFCRVYLPIVCSLGGIVSQHVNRRGIAIGVAALVSFVVGLWVWLGPNANGSAADTADRARDVRAASVVVAQPQIKPFAQEVEALGTVRANESVDITSKVADRVAVIRFKEGQQVRKGDVLVELDDAEPRAELAAAEAALAESRSQYKRSQELYQTRALSEAQMEQLKATMLSNEARAAAARSRVNDRLIVAPFSGRVGLRNVSVGGLVSPGQVITTLDDLSVVKLDFSVPELFLSALRPELPVSASATAYPGETFAGRVVSVGTRVDPTTRSVTIRALIDNREHRLRPGMFMTVKLVRAESDALMVPERAIVPEERRHYLFVVEEGVARKREVVIGRRRPGEVEILEGVLPTDQVIVDGMLDVRDGQPVRQADVAGARTTDVPT